MGKENENKSQNYENIEFDWVQISADLDPSNNETFLAKCQRKFAENPFVPIGELRENIFLTKLFLFT